MSKSLDEEVRELHAAVRDLRDAVWAVLRPPVERLARMLRLR